MSGLLETQRALLVVADMVTFLITSLFILAFLAVAVYFWQKPDDPPARESLLPPPAGRGLFIGDAFDDQSPAEADAEALANVLRQRTELLNRAKAGEKATLQEARDTQGAGLYEEVLDSLVAAADSDPKLLSLVSYVTRHELRLNRKLAERFVECFTQNPDRSSTAKMLHVAALSDDAAVYQIAVDAALGFWRKGSLPDVSADELRSILEGEFWILSSRARSSGAGFLLKRTLAKARRELEAARTN